MPATICTVGTVNEAIFSMHDAPNACKDWETVASSILFITKEAVLPTIVFDAVESCMANSIIDGPHCTM